MWKAILSRGQTIQPLWLNCVTTISHLSLISWILGLIEHIVYMSFKLTFFHNLFVSLFIVVQLLFEGGMYIFPQKPMDMNELASYSSNCATCDSASPAWHCKDLTHFLPREATSKDWQCWRQIHVCGVLVEDNGHQLPLQLIFTEFPCISVSNWPDPICNHLWVDLPLCVHTIVV